MFRQTRAAWNALVAPWKSSKPAQLYHPVGCLDCRMTGFRGRVGIYEIMPMSNEIKRLVRTLCPKCKQPGGMRAEDEAAWNALVAPWKATKPAQLFHPVGCLECRMTGYKGRVGIYEIMPLSNEIKILINSGAELARLREQAMREGMKPLRIAGAKKVAAGLTTIEEIIKVAPPLVDPGSA